MTEEVMSEGAVLLKNDSNALPLASASKVSVFVVCRPHLRWHRHQYSGRF